MIREPQDAIRAIELIHSQLLILKSQEIPQFDADKIELLCIGIREKLNSIQEEILHPDEISTFTALELIQKWTDFILLCEGMPCTQSPRIQTDLNQFDASQHKYLSFDLREAEYRLPLEFHMVSRNLLANARKYTRVGDRIKLSLREESDFYCFTVEDTGIGIPAEELTQVALPGYRASNNSKPGFGYGLGLTIADNFCQKYHGHLTIDSKLDCGTRVELKFCV